MSDSGPAAPDIITYIGVPLAVLGVVPIIYTSINSVVTAVNIKRRLKKNAITHAATRGSMLSGIVEVEFPLLSLTPPEREDPEYWTLNRRPSELKGGSWSLFNWNKLVIGKRQYRVQHSTETKEPQAEVDFDELLSYLIDRGAIPDAKGFRLLSLTGLWTPSNTTLLRSPDDKGSVLRITFPDDSDGMLSLALQWDPSWTADQGDKLPPHWIRIKDHRLPVKTKSKAEGVEIETEEGENGEPPSYKQAASSDTDASSTEKTPGNTSKDVSKPGGNDANVKAFQVHVSMKSSAPVVDTVMRDSELLSSRSNRMSSMTYPHLERNPISQWFPVFATALGSLNGASIWTIHLPTALTTLAARDTIPCGVLEMAEILRESEIPPWATEYDPNEDSRERMEEMSASHRAFVYETTLPPAQRKAAESKRRAEETHNMMARMQRRQRRDREREELRQREAVLSERSATDRAANGVLRRLRKEETRERGGNPEDDNDRELRLQVTEGPWRNIETAADTILYMMIREEEKAKGICSMLDRWRVWVERGGMNKEDYEFVMQDEAKLFCYAIVLMALLKMESNKQESNLAIDLQECIKTWRRVRLG